MLKPLIFVVSAHPNLFARIALLFHGMNIPVAALIINPIDSDRIRFTIEVFAEPRYTAGKPTIPISKGETRI